jgi:hypothetical protein
MHIASFLNKTVHREKASVTRHARLYVACRPVAFRKQALNKKMAFAVHITADAVGNTLHIEKLHNLYCSENLSLLG